LAVAYPVASYLHVRESQEEQSILTHLQGTLLQRHGKEMKVYFSFFFGTLLAFTVAGIFLPAMFFSEQAEIVGRITGAAGMTVSGTPSIETVLATILTNNLRVFAATFLLSFAVSAGMVFIVVWNSSVLGLLLSDFIKGQSVSALVCLPFGIVEIAGFAIAGLAGALLSHQFGHYESRAFRIMQKDVLFLLLIGAGMIIVSGVAEAILI